MKKQQVSILKNKKRKKKQDVFFNARLDIVSFNLGVSSKSEY